ACDGAIPVFSVCACDFAIDWSGITADLYGETVDPSGFEVVAWVRRSTEESGAEVLADVCEGRKISASDTQSYVDAEVVGATTAHLSELSFLGTPAELPEPGQTYWLWWAADD